MASIPWFGAAFAAAPDMARTQHFGPVDTSLIQDFIKLRASTDAGKSVVWGRGIQYGYVAGALTPFFGRDVIVLTTSTALPDGSYRVDTREASFVTDLVGDKPLRTMTNPLTDAPMTIPNNPLNAFGVIVDSKGQVRLAASPRSGVDYRAWLAHPRLIGPEVGVDERLSVHITEPDGRTRWLEEIIYHRADIAAAARGDVAKYPSRRTAMSMRSWPDWTGLEGKEGYIMGMYQSRRIELLDDVPASARAACEAMQPEFLKEVTAAIAGLK